MADEYGDFFSTPEGMTALRTMLRFAKAVEPITKWFGLKSDLVANMLKQCDDLFEVRKFNDVFLSRGWAAHRWLKMSSAIEALRHASEENWEAADESLIQAYSPQVIRVMLLQMSTLRCFARRRRLALLALDDYEARRFHACVPVVLALIDGMGQELTGQGFLRQGVRFAREDSFLEVGPGVATLIRKLTESRGRVNDDPIDFPYRHGILHGSDLGYDNQLVAAKAWAALLAVGSCAVDIEVPPLPKEPPKGLLDALSEYTATRARIDEMKSYMDAWSARDPEVVLEAIAMHGPEPDTPEEAACRLIKAWQRGNYGEMAQLSTETQTNTINAVAGRIRNNIGTAPDSFRVIEVDDSASAAAWVELRAVWGDGHEDDLRLRLLYFVHGETKPSTMGGGQWLILSLWPLEAASLRLEAINSGRS